MNKQFNPSTIKPFITEAEVQARQAAVPFVNREGIVSNFVVPNPHQPKAGEDQKVFALGGVPRAFLRVQYYVQPTAEDNTGGTYFWAQVHPKESEYLIESPKGIFTVIAEYNNWEDLPIALRRLELDGRPGHEALGWTKADIQDFFFSEWLASDE